MSMTSEHSSTGDHFVVLAFDSNNRMALRVVQGVSQTIFEGTTIEEASSRLSAVFPSHTQVCEYFSFEQGNRNQRVFFSQIKGLPLEDGVLFASIEELERHSEMSALLCAIVQQIEPYLIEIPYLHLGENDFIHRFRPEKERNSAIYEQDTEACALYYSRLCEAIKLLARKQERSAGPPVHLDFGAIRYVIPSHFGFCLGVKNAIERAYETLAANPTSRVFMLSELIHNPFVNSDLLRRGLRYLQSDKGVPFTTEGGKSSGVANETLIWDTLHSDDIVIIPAFGATNRDKKRLIKKGIAVCQYDATCMLVEKVWKSARVYGREGYTVIIHGKHEHEETKATFSNTRRYAPSLIIRNIEESRILGEIILCPEVKAAQERLEKVFEGRFTPGFRVDQHLNRVAVVNQTTLLSNETISIIDYLKSVYEKKFGEPNRVGGPKRRDTLCYATQVNQDALARSLEYPLQAAFVIGGKNSSNTYQLYRLCEQKLGESAFFIQSEEAIHPEGYVDHFVFPSLGSKNPGSMIRRKLWQAETAEPRHVLVTGGASCPDGIINQVIARINTLFPAEKIRPINDVIADLEREATPDGMAR
jgi:4-hydroxy-3-methylbut-2-enyl diphosphate reductase